MAKKTFDLAPYKARFKSLVSDRVDEYSKYLRKTHPDAKFFMRGESDLIRFLKDRKKSRPLCEKDEEVLRMDARIKREMRKTRGW